IFEELESERGGQERSVTTSPFIIDGEQLAPLNGNLSGADETRLKLTDLGIFPTNRENVRILDVKVIGADGEALGGAVGQNAEAFFTFEHLGRSTFVSNGKKLS